MEPLPPEWIAYMHWDLKLKPHEYWAMDAEEWHTAVAVQAAFKDGVEAAADDYHKDQEKQAEREQRQKEALIQLAEMAS